MAAVSKGRGRGRGNIISKTDPGKNFESKTAEEIVRGVQQGPVAPSIDYLCRATTQQDFLDETVNLTCDKVLENVEFIESAGEFLQGLWDSKMLENTSVRKPLLVRLQKLYADRMNLSDVAFQGYASFLCDLFNRLQINGSRLAALIGPVYNVLQDLLKRKDNSHYDNILTFHDLMCKHGGILEKNSQDKMTELMNNVRELALSETTTKTSKVQLCVLLEIIELSASKWEQPDEVKKYYSDTLADLLATV